ncbi:MAG: T9SS type A sorting domain-containing protein, partial [Candidatus Aegiribacteria sp.]|nr:T9SS type A sorting domain-containing protein [Candidatus Aegiribacteria sp.]
LDSSDHPHIAYCSADGLYLMYTSWNGSDWHHELVDTLPGYFSGDPDLVLDDLDRPHIAFHCGYPDFALKYSWNDCTGIGEDDEQICTRLTCGLLHPNPTTGTTSMQFSLATDSHVEITMYDISGRVVERSVSGQYTAGTHTASFSVSSPGIYLVRISSENQMNTKCFIVID